MTDRNPINHGNNGDDRSRLDNRVAGQANKYFELPDYTRAWIEDLRIEDIARIKKSVEMTENIESFGKWAKWFIVGAVALLGGIAGLMASITQIASYFKKG